MTFSKYTELENLRTTEEIEEEIFLLQKNLFDLKLKRSTNQKVKPHLFKQIRHRLAQLKYKYSLVLKKIN